MAQEPSLESLQKLFRQGQVAFEAAEQRIKDLEQMQAGELLEGRNNLGTWDRYTVTRFSKHLDELGQIVSPSREQQLLMVELHRLVNLGNRMIEKMNVLQALMKEKVPRLRNRRQTSESSTTTKVEIVEELNAGSVPAPEPVLPKPDSKENRSQATVSAAEQHSRSQATAREVEEDNRSRATRRTAATVRTEASARTRASARTGASMRTATQDTRSRATTRVRNEDNRSQATARTSATAKTTASMRTARQDTQSRATTRATARAGQEDSPSQTTTCTASTARTTTTNRTAAQDSRSQATTAQAASSAHVADPDNVSRITTGTAAQDTRSRMTTSTAAQDTCSRITTSTARHGERSQAQASKAGYGHRSQATTSSPAQDTQSQSTVRPAPQDNTSQATESTAVPQTTVPDAASSKEPEASDEPPVKPVPGTEPLVEHVPASPKVQRPNNLLAYDLLGVPNDAPLTDIKKAIRKQIMQRHPDRLKGVPDASSKFADFGIVCAVFNNDATRQEYDQTGEVEDIDDLAAMIERLKLA